MNIEYLPGDLFKTDHMYILHGCNSKGVMGSGVAKTVRQLYPEAYDKYTIWCSKGFRLGDYLIVNTGGKSIINAVTQQNYGTVAVQTGPNPVRHVSYDAVATIFFKLNKELAGHAISMPKVGASLGGGDWDVISAIIESECKNIWPIVYLPI